jgi:uncharacterized protein YdeI (YjbR/CyaY-like superfamily)
MLAVVVRREFCVQVTFTDRESWRAWLDANGQNTREVWLVFFKKHTGKPCVTYEAAVEEALCVGWIDSLVKRLDDDRYARKFTPRTNTRNWSNSNLRRFHKLVASGRMTAAGSAKYEPIVRSSKDSPSDTIKLPDLFRKALKNEGKAREFFDNLAPSYRRNFVEWVGSAKREETRKKRLKEALALLRAGKKLGMK